MSAYGCYLGQMKTPYPTVVENEFVKLSPVTPDEAKQYFDIGQDASIWRYLARGPLRSEQVALDWIETMTRRAQQTGSVTFSVYDKKSGQLAGSTSLLDVRVEHAGLEIGYTWYGLKFQRSHVNTATKLALLKYGFDDLGAERVQLQTDLRNEVSQKAIARIGGLKEGVLRKHKIYPSGFVRDSVMFSIVKQDWQVVERGLLGMLQASNHRG